MSGALLFVIGQSARNAVWSKLQRLRQPRYAIITAVGLLYFGQMFFQSGRGWQMLGITGTGVLTFAPVLILLFMARPWWWPGGGRGGLGFSTADVHLLFPAPLARRQLVAYRILQAQGGLVFGALIFTVISQPPLDQTFLFRFVGLWCITGILAAHGMVVTLSRSGVVASDTFAMLRRWIPAVALLAGLVVVVATLAAQWSSIAQLTGASAKVAGVGAVLSGGLAGAVLWPFRVLVQLPTATGLLEFVSLLPIVLLMWGLTAFWVLRTDAAFEETAAEQAEKVAQALGRKTMTAAPKKARGALFALRPLGRPEVAFLWKNLIAAGQVSKFYLLITLTWTIPVVIVFLTTEGTTEISGLLAMLCLGLAAMTILTGALQLNFDLRQDLPSLALIKSWPVDGATVVRGEVLAPTLVLWGFTTFLVAVGTALGSRTAIAEFAVTYLELTQWALAAICLSGGVILMQVVVQNAIAVMFPAWIRLGPKAAVGMEAMGQQMVMMFGSFLLLPVLAIPAIAVGSIVWVGTMWSAGHVPVIVPAIATSVVLLVESAVAIEVVGRMLDRTDISAVAP